MIELVGVQQTYGARTVLDIPHLAFQPGERTALLGANGSGKSTLLSILSGQLAPSAGRVAFGDIAPRDVGYLPQKPYAFDLTVLQNVRLACGGDTERARAALARVGMGEMANARGSRLSGGETQRMALARLLARDWRALLLDEPASAADLNAGDAIERALLAYAAETGCAILFATHAPGQAKRLASRVVVLENGRVAEDGDAADVIDAPRSVAAQTLLNRWRG